jgi:hypothetical protein
VATSLVEGILKVCKILHGHSVEYLVVGGAAVALHGFFRQSHDSSGHPTEKPDLDFWYNSTYDNYFKLLDALEELGHDVTEFRTETAPNPKKSFFRFEQAEFTLDFLPELRGLGKFRPAYEKRITSRIYDIDITFIDYNDLIKSKEVLGRPKDIEDIEQLRLRREDSD